VFGSDLDLPWAYLCTCLVIALPKGYPGIPQEKANGGGGKMEQDLGAGTLARTRGTE